MRLLDRLAAIWRAPESLYELETLIMATASDYAARLDAVTNEIAQELRDAQAGADASWSAALDGPIARLEGLGKSTEDPEPSTADDSAGTEPTA